MSVEIMLWQTIEAVGKLAVKVNELAEATLDLVEVTKAVHRERAAQIRQEIEELDPDNHPKVNNFKMWHLQERLRALEMPVRSVEEMAILNQAPRVNDKVKVIGGKVAS